MVLKATGVKQSQMEARKPGGREDSHEDEKKRKYVRSVILSPVSIAFSIFKCVSINT